MAKPRGTTRKIAITPREVPPTPGCLQKKELALGPLVVIVNVTGTLVTLEVKVTLAGLKLQVLFGGRFEHIAGESVVDPVSPFCDVKVKVVEPDCPGLAIAMTCGFAAIEKP